MRLAFQPRRAARDGCSTCAGHVPHCGALVLNQGTLSGRGCGEKVELVTSVWLKWPGSFAWRCTPPSSPPSDTPWQLGVQRACPQRRGPHTRASACAPRQLRNSRNAVRTFVCCLRGWLAVGMGWRARQIENDQCLRSLRRRRRHRGRGPSTHPESIGSG